MAFYSYRDSNIVNEGGVGGSGASSGDNIVTFTQNSKGEILASKTVDEIANIIMSGGIVFGSYMSYSLMCHIGYDNIVFYCLEPGFSTSTSNGHFGIAGFDYVNIMFLVGNMDNQWTGTMETIYGEMPSYD